MTRVIDGCQQQEELINGCEKTNNKLPTGNNNEKAIKIKGKISYQHHQQT